MVPRVRTFAALPIAAAAERMGRSWGDAVTRVQGENKLGCKSFSPHAWSHPCACLVVTISPVRRRVDHSSCGAAELGPELLSLDAGSPWTLHAMTTSIISISPAPSKFLIPAAFILWASEAPTRRGLAITIILYCRRASLGRLNAFKTILLLLVGL
jgi:hypothetical protein